MFNVSSLSSATTSGVSSPRQCQSPQPNVNCFANPPVIRSRRQHLLLFSSPYSHSAENLSSLFGGATAAAAAAAAATGNR